MITKASFFFTTSAIEWQPEDGGERGRMTAKQVLFFSISGGQEARPRGRAGATAVAVGAPATARAPAAPAPAGAPRFSTPRSTPRSTQHASPEYSRARRRAAPPPPTPPHRRAATCGARGQHGSVVGAKRRTRVAPHDREGFRRARAPPRAPQHPFDVAEFPSPREGAVPLGPQPVLQRVQHSRGRRARAAAALLGLPARFAAPRLFGQRDGVEVGAAAVGGALGAKAARHAKDDPCVRWARFLHRG